MFQVQNVEQGDKDCHNVNVLGFDFITNYAKERNINLKKESCLEKIGIKIKIKINRQKQVLKNWKTL